MTYRIKIVLFLLMIYTPFWAASKNDNTTQIQKLVNAYRIIDGLYVDDVDEAKLVEKAVQSMIKELDPHSVYISPEDVEKMNEPLKGNFDGIGIQFDVLFDTLIVVSPISGGPSEKVGILAGDRIVKVDTTIIAGVHCKRSKMMELLKGKKGTHVTVGVKRKGVKDLIYFDIVRDKIPIFSLDAAYMVNSTIGYIKLNRFSAKTYHEFMEAIVKLKKEGMEELIIDLQGNGGGYMQPTIEIADQLLPKDRMIVYTEGEHSPKHAFKSHSDGIFEKGELIIMVDESSASSSEILTGAMQDWDRALIVGRRSFGKGLVQKPINLPDGSMIRLTTARYHTPCGRCIQKPYEKGHKKEYSKDLQERFERGELISADSINLPDSLKYKTLVKGRNVYGGGGIMPDVFIPIDTTSYSSFHKKVVSSGLLRRFMLNYLDENRDDLTDEYADNFDQFNNKFKISEDLFQRLIDEAAQDSIKYDSIEFAISHDYLFIQMKALVARDLFGYSEYYQVMNTRNNSFLKSVELLENKKDYMAYYRNK